MYSFGESPEPWRLWQQRAVKSQQQLLKQNKTVVLLRRYKGLKRPIFIYVNCLSLSPKWRLLCEVRFLEKKSLLQLISTFWCRNISHHCHIIHSSSFTTVIYNSIQYSLAVKYIWAFSNIQKHQWQIQNALGAVVNLASSGRHTRQGRKLTGVHMLMQKVLVNKALQYSDKVTHLIKLLHPLSLF